MSQFNKIKSLPTPESVRKAGLNFACFMYVCRKVARYEAERRRRLPMKKRGRKS
jgi:hypothetical protein